MEERGVASRGVAWQAWFVMARQAESGHGMAGVDVWGTAWQAWFLF